MVLMSAFSAQAESAMFSSAATAMESINSALFIIGDSLNEFFHSCLQPGWCRDAPSTSSPIDLCATCTGCPSARYDCRDLYQCNACRATAQASIHAVSGVLRWRGSRAGQTLAAFARYQ